MSALATSLFTDEELQSSDTELTMLSFGAGQDSTALLLKYIHNEDFRAKYAPNNFIVVFSDTGNEHEHTYEHIAKMKVLCDEHNIVFVHLTPNMGFHGDNWHSLGEAYRAYDSIGSKGYPKVCTVRLKIDPIYKFLEEFLSENYELPKGRKRAHKEFSRLYGKINVLIGIAKGEENRVAKPFTQKDGLWKVMALQNVYPLIEIGMNRSDCQQYIAKYIEHEVLPSNCMMCPHMSLQELLWLHRNKPSTFEEWCELEENKFKKWQHIGSSNIGVWAKWIKEENRPYSLRDALEDAKKEFGHWTNDDLHSYKMNHGCVSTKY